jgi:hypothetical protein
MTHLRLFNNIWLSLADFLFTAQNPAPATQIYQIVLFADFNFRHPKLIKTGRSLLQNSISTVFISPAVP